MSLGFNQAYDLYLYIDLGLPQCVCVCVCVFSSYENAPSLSDHSYNLELQAQLFYPGKTSLLSA